MILAAQCAATGSRSPGRLGWVSANMSETVTPPGAPEYREKCDEVAACGYPGFTFRSACSEDA